MSLRRPSYAEVAATLALVLAGSGASYAAGLAANSVGTAQLKDGAVTTPKLRKNAVTSTKVRADALTGDDVDESSLTVPGGSRSYAGIEFRPRDDDLTWNGTPQGGIYNTGDGGYYDLRVDLPQGAQITEVVFYVQDTSGATDVGVYFRRHQPQNNNAALLFGDETSGTAPGIRVIDVTPNPAEVVDNEQYSYLLTFFSAGTTSATSVMGAKVTWSSAPLGG